LRDTLEMKFKIFTLHPDIFSSFISNSLIARAIAKQIIEIKTIDWRQDFGIGNYKQVDDKPFGGGSGMVLMADPIINAMMAEGCLKVEERSPFQETDLDTNSIQNFGANIKLPLVKGLAAQADWGLNDSKVLENKQKDQQSLPPNNNKFYNQIKSGQFQTKKVNILMTPRGFPMTQQVVEWLAQDFEEINILCGRYEGFDARINDHIDLELSIGNFVLNGGEVGSMCLVEAVSRLVPDFITKNTSVLHDSFSSGLNNYNEFEFENSKLQYQRELEKSKNSQKLKVKSEKLDKNSIQNFGSNQIPLVRGGSEADGVFTTSDRTRPHPASPTGEEQSNNLFNNTHWLQNILPHIEHPQYTRPNIWQDPITNEQKKVPEVLLSGDHAKIQKWRMKWW
jgi:tRNA G37 N-methylase TrmD